MNDYIFPDRTTSAQLLPTDTQFRLERHLMLPCKFFDDSPGLLRSFVILDIDDFVSRVRLEGSNGFSVSKHQISRTKSKPFLHDVGEVRGDGVGWRQNKVSDGRDRFGILEQFFSTPTDLMEVFDQEAFDQRFIFLKCIEHGFQFFRFEDGPANCVNCLNVITGNFSINFRMYSRLNSA